jgi:tetratricopeptide (TPR) repeat protein
MLFLLVPITGCTEQTTSTATQTASAAATKSADAGDLTLALRSMRQLAEGSDVQAAQRTIFYLNQWLSSDEDAYTAWQPDRMLETLPRAFRKVEGLADLDDSQFNGQSDVPFLDDISYLQQNLWLRDIAQRAARQTGDSNLQAWLKEIETTVGIPEAEQLAAAERLLDWTTRNIQLDPLPAVPRDPLATAGAGETIMPSARGEVGPGYAHLPIETLLYGHGDAQERARIFILLCRQLGIDAVMLGFREERSVVPRGWIPAALVGGKLYLFETALGLPIPGPDGKGIATLAEVKKQPEILRQLDVSGLPPYPISEKDFKSGEVAMIDAEPAALSRRMQLLQAAMPANSRLALAVLPSRLDPLLRKANVSGVSLWNVPFDAILYRIGRQALAAKDPNVAKEFRRQDIIFSPSRPLVKARNLHLQGRYENEDQKFGARALYLQCRPPNREIEAIRTNEGYRKAIGLQQTLPENPNQRDALLAFYIDIAYHGKFDATYWLGLTYYEAGKPGAAIEWLKRTVEDVPTSTWVAGGRYNLARCYEQLGQPDVARQWLESDKDSPQRHGNLLRAKRLVKGAGSTTASADAGTK